MSGNPVRVDRRSFVAGAAAGVASLMGGGRPAAAQAKFPSRKFTVLIPTGQGGGAERLARAFDAVWSKDLGQPFEYEFFPGAAGQVGYTLYVQKRDRGGHNLLFGNMGPEMIMYALQKPPYKFPEDFVYFCRTDIDDSCIFVRTQSPFKRVEDVVAEAKKRTLNVATSRIPHPASIGILALGKATGSKFNLVPYGGGNPTQVAVLSGEVDCGVLPAAGIVSLPEQFTVLGIFNKKENVLAKYTNNAPLINAVFGTNLPDLYSSRAWAIHTEFAAKNPAAMALLSETAKKVCDDPAFRSEVTKAGQVAEAVAYGDQATCTEYALAMIALTEEYRDVLSARGGKKT
jgi:tripartite-type tricarboxylate transporter receptor subunit TctC